MIKKEKWKVSIHMCYIMRSGKSTKSNETPEELLNKAYKVILEV